MSETCKACKGEVVEKRSDDGALISFRCGCGRTAGVHLSGGALETGIIQKGEGMDNMATRHATTAGIEQDDDGFFGFTCECGHVAEGFPDVETLLDEAIAHGYVMGAVEGRS